MVPCMPISTVRIGLTLVFITTSAAGLSYLGAAGPARNAKILNQYQLPPTSLTSFGYTQAELNAAAPLGLTVDDQPAIGSGLIALGGGRYLGITDRGPNIDHFPVDATADCFDGSANGKTHPMPQFTPAIVRFRAHGSVIDIEDIVNLVAPSAVGPGTVGITGLSNITGGDNTFDDPSFLNPCTNTNTNIDQRFNVNGMDVEDFALLPNGKFIGVEENRPSLFIGDVATGLIEKRYIPETMGVPGALYAVESSLPEVLKRRSKNRGFEAIAISPDRKTAFTATQSPLEVGCAGGTGTCRNNRILRILELDVSNPLAVAVTGQYLFQMSDPSLYRATSRALKLSAMSWVGPNKLLLLERSDDAGMGGVRLILVDLSNAQDINGMFDESLTPEQQTDGTALITKVTSEVVFEEFEYQSDRLFWTYKLEGMAIRNANNVDIINDNDFGIVGAPAPTNLWTLKLPGHLPLGK